VISLLIHTAITNKVQARAQFKRRSTANNVQISIPVPEDADTPRFRTNIGTVHYAPETSSIVWKIKQFGGGKEFLMRAELGLPSVRGDDEKGGGMMGGFGGSMGGVGAGKGKRPINVKFEIPYFTTSGIQVRYLKIIEPKVSHITNWGGLADADGNLAAIPVIALGEVYHSVGGYRGQVTGCEVVGARRVRDDLYTNEMISCTILSDQNGNLPLLQERITGETKLHPSTLKSR
jgi:hypothetical protein